MQQCKQYLNAGGKQCWFECLYSTFLVKPTYQNILHRYTDRLALPKGHIDMPSLIAQWNMYVILGFQLWHTLSIFDERQKNLRFSNWVASRGECLLRSLLSFLSLHLFLSLCSHALLVLVQTKSEQKFNRGQWLQYNKKRKGSQRQNMADGTPKSYHNYQHKKHSTQTLSETILLFLRL